MSTQAPPPPPPPGAAPPPSYNPNPAGTGSGAAKGGGGLPLWGKIGIGCGCLTILIIIVGFLALGWGAKKLGDAVSDPATLAETAIKLHPDLDLVSSDQDAGTITVRNKATNETASFNYSDIMNGNFSFEGSDGQKVNIDASGGGVSVTDAEGKETNYQAEQDESGGIKITSSDGGELNIGQGSSTPSWVPQHPSVDFSEGGMSSVTGDKASGIAQGRSQDGLEDLESWYTKQLEANGFTIERSYIEMGGQRQVILNSSKEGVDTMAVALSDDGSQRSVTITYSGPNQ